MSAPDPPEGTRPPTGRLTGTLPRPRLGASPGSLPYLPEAERAPARFRTFRYDADIADERAPCSVGEAVALRGTPGTVWVDVVGTKDHDAITEIGEAYGIHPLVQEDLALAGQRPKIEGYPAGDGHDEQLFVVARMLHPSPTPEGHLQDEQVGFVLGPGYLLTFQEQEGDLFEPVRDRIRRGGGRVRTRGPDYLAYALLDVLVDGYFVVLEHIGERIERVEEAVMDDPRREHQTELRALRRAAIHLRRAAWPLREVLAALLRDESGLIEESTRVFLRDAYDHAVQVVDVVESFREALSSLSDLYVSTLSQQTNEVMKVLTVVGTIFIPLSFFAGIYGMNFEHMPELSWRYGYFGFLAFALAVLVSSLAYFRWRGWI